MGSHSLLQGIFLTQGSNLCLLHWQADSLPLSHQSGTRGGSEASAEFVQPTNPTSLTVQVISQHKCIQDGERRERWHPRSSQLVFPIRKKNFHRSPSQTSSPHWPKSDYMATCGKFCTWFSSFCNWRQLEGKKGPEMTCVVKQQCLPEKPSQRNHKTSEWRLLKPS